MAGNCSGGFIGRRFGLGQCEFGIAGRGRWLAGQRRILTPRRDPRLQAVMLRGRFVAGLHVEQREVRVDELFLRLEFLRLVPLGDGRREIALAIVSHAQGELRVEVGWLRRQDRGQLRNRAVKISRAEIKQRVVVLILQVHSFGRHGAGRVAVME